MGDICVNLKKFLKYERLAEDWGLALIGMTSYMDSSQWDNLPDWNSGRWHSRAGTKAWGHFECDKSTQTTYFVATGWTGTYHKSEPNIERNYQDYWENRYVAINPVFVANKVTGQPLIVDIGDDIALQLEFHSRHDENAWYGIKEAYVVLFGSYASIKKWVDDITIAPEPYDVYIPNDNYRPYDAAGKPTTCEALGLETLGQTIQGEWICKKEYRRANEERYGVQLWDFVDLKYCYCNCCSVAKLLLEKLRSF